MKLCVSRVDICTADHRESQIRCRCTHCLGNVRCLWLALCPLLRAELHACLHGSHGLHRGDGFDHDCGLHFLQGRLPSGVVGFQGNMSTFSWRRVMQLKERHTRHHTALQGSRDTAEESSM